LRRPFQIFNPLDCRDFFALPGGLRQALLSFFPFLLKFSFTVEHDRTFFSSSFPLFMPPEPGVVSSAACPWGVEVGVLLLWSRRGCRSPGVYRVMWSFASVSCQTFFPSRTQIFDPSFLAPPPSVAESSLRTILASVRLFSSRFRPPILFPS